MGHEKQHISIWFFIGAMLVIYGVLITGQGIYEILSPPETKVVLAELHVSAWWGVLLLIIGAFYSWMFFPTKR